MFQSTSFHKYSQLKARPSFWGRGSVLFMSRLPVWGRADKKKLPVLSRHVDSTILFSRLPFPCRSSPAGPDSPDWRELPALLQTVCQLQRRVYGGKWASLRQPGGFFFFLYNGCSWWSFCHFFRALLNLFLPKLLVRCKLSLIWTN